MKGIYIFLIVFLFVNNAIIGSAQNNTDSLTLLSSAQKSYSLYKQKANFIKRQMDTNDSLYLYGEYLYLSNSAKFKKAKSAFKSLKKNYKAEILPYKRQLKSRDKKQSAKARRMLHLIKMRFNENGTAAANAANQASREMVRAQKIMTRAKEKNAQLLPRFNKFQEQVLSWKKIIYDFEASFNEN